MQITSSEKAPVMDNDIKFVLFDSRCFVREYTEPERGINVYTYCSMHAIIRREATAEEIMHRRN